RFSRDWSSDVCSSDLLLVDLDPHGSLTSYFRQNPDNLERSLYHLFFEQRYKDKAFIQTVIKPTSLPNVSLLPATTSLATLERQVSGQEGMGLVLARSLEIGRASCRERV